MNRQYSLHRSPYFGSGQAGLQQSSRTFINIFPPPRDVLPKGLSLPLLDPYIQNAGSISSGDTLKFKPESGIEGRTRLVFLGDTGDPPKEEKPILDNLTSLIEEENREKPLVVLNSGDYLYSRKNDAITPRERHWNEYSDTIFEPWQNVIGSGDGQGRAPILPVMGDKDVFRDFLRGVDINEDMTQMWGIPRYYKLTLANGKVDLFAIDTTVICSDIDNAVNRRVFAAPALKDEAEAMAKGQLKWLEKSLKESEADFKIVYGHFPIYVTGGNGSGETQELAKKMRPLDRILRQYGVDLYVAGHYHQYERAFRINQDTLMPEITYITSGGGTYRTHDNSRDLPKYSYFLSTLT